MTKFRIHDLESSPATSREMLEKVKGKFGFIPNMLGAMAESPATLKGYLTLSGILEESAFTPAERQILLLTTARENGCEYCVAAHTIGAGKAGTPPSVIASIRDDKPIADKRLAALHDFCRKVVGLRGWASETDVKAFLDTGYTRAQLLEVILAVGLKTISNYMNHIASTPLDAAFKSVEWRAPEKAG